jgi:predicted GIY-YIG superfamily endonuclease
MMQVYLFHFEQPLAHAQHYLGSTKNLPSRVRQHRCGEGDPSGTDLGGRT